MPVNQQIRLRRRPAPGLLTKDDFEVFAAPLPVPGPGEFRVRITHVSLDPAMRGWVNDTRSYMPPVGIGEVMRGYSSGFVDASNNPAFPVGQGVASVFGVQQYAISNGKRVIKADTALAPIERWIGGLGMPGWTAYFGLLEVGQPKAGETVVVSAASGAVGSVAGQIARIKGCRAVGIAGGPEKCRYVKDELGFDACVDYKAGNLAADLATACPSGIDVDFENVGGEVLDAILPQMNPFGRIALCGTISGYTTIGAAPAVHNLRVMTGKRLRLQGLLVSDWASRIPEAIAALSGWHREDRLKLREDVRTGGMAAFVDTLNLLYTSGNKGKLVLQVA